MSDFLGFFLHDFREKNKEQQKEGHCHNVSTRQQTGCVAVERQLYFTKQHMIIR